jgi:diguanylate cyclase (GGDEF)-like protein
MFDLLPNRNNVDAVFRPRIGQIILSLFVIVGIALFAYFSFTSHSAQREIREDLYAQETDASALSFTQRDAFGLAFSMAEWGSGLQDSREVQIARALLGQRLGVITSSGEPTINAAPESFRSALQDLDEIIVALTDVPVERRLTIIRDVDPVVETFLTETRLLSQAFQERSRAVIEEAVQSRNQAELRLIVTFGLVGAALLILVTWIAIDIDRGYRRASEMIDSQRAELKSTIATLQRTQEVDVMASKLIQQISDGVAVDQVLGEVGTAFAGILPGVRVDVELNGPQRGSVHVVANSDSTLSEEELNTSVSRIRDVVSVALNREIAEQELKFQRTHDALTGLPNRSVLTEETRRALLASERTGGVAAIFLMDIDRFRDFNNSLGHSVGDILLIELADRLRSTVTGSEVAARLSGDEYAVVAHFRDRDEAVSRARQIFDELHFTSLAGATETNVSVSMGVAISATDHPGAAGLQRSSAMAIYLAKEADRSGFVVFSESEHSALSDRLSEELAARNALRNGEFTLFYQPIMRLENNRPVGVEALLRWDRPGIGVLCPDAFLETTRRAGILVELSEEIIEEALSFWSRNLVKAFDLGQDGMPYVSINIDPVQLDDPLFATFIVGAARRNSVPLAAIVLEVTEHVLSESPMAVEQLDALRRQGVRIALDDFGTGYSALSQAQHLPLDILKVDRSFIPIDELAGRDRRLVSDIHAIAATLGLSTTVEGVESREVAATLRSLGVEFAQGYLYSEPLPEDECINWIHQWTSLANAEGSN